MGSIPDPGELSHPPSPSASPPPPIPSFDDFQRQTSLMTSCTLLWQELSDHFTTLEQDLRRKSDALKRKIQTLDDQTNTSLKMLERREITIAGSVELAMGRADASKRAALKLLDDDTSSDHHHHNNKSSTDNKNNNNNCDGGGGGEVDDGEGLLLKLRGFCLRMDHGGFWKFVIIRKKELDILRVKIPAALGDCIDPPRFVLEAISEVFPVDRRGEKSEKGNDLGWACVLLLESLIPVVIDPVIGKERLLVTPTVKKKAKDIAETWKDSLEERGGIENVKTPDVHTFLQHLVTFGIVKDEDFNLYRKLVIASAWRKQMPKLAVSLGLGDDMPDMIEELISRGQQVDAVHFTHEVGLVDKFPPVPLLKAFLEDSKKAATAILEDPNNSGRAAYLANRKEQSAIRAVLKCIEEYKLEAEMPSENLKKRLEQLEKAKTEKKRSPPVVPANKRTRVSNNIGPMPPAKAGRIANAYVSSFPATATTFVPSPPHPSPYHAGFAPPQAYAASPPPPMYGNRSPPYHPYSPEAASPPYHGGPVNYTVYGAYGNAMAPPSYTQAFY